MKTDNNNYMFIKMTLYLIYYYYYYNLKIKILYKLIILNKKTKQKKEFVLCILFDTLLFAIYFSKFELDNTPQIIIFNKNIKWNVFIIFFFLF